MKVRDFPINLARKAIREYVCTRRIISPSSRIPKEFQRQAGAFVSLHERGKLRGCIGTYLPQQNNIASEIIENAISAATRDPRFPPVRESELDKLEISVDVLSPPESIPSKEALGPDKYGVIVSKGWQRGLLLPNLEGVNTIEEQLAIAKQKAGLASIPDENLQLQRFTVTRYKHSD